MKHTLDKAVALVAAHRLIATTIVFLLFAFAVGIGRFPAINVQYAARFGDSVSPADQVSFVFDDNPGYSKSATQRAFPINGNAAINVDSLNMDSRSLVISAPETAKLSRLEASVVADGKTLYGVSVIPGASIERTSDSNHGGNVRFSVSAEQLTDLQRKLAFTSEIKLAILAALLVLYAITICRMGILRHLDRRYFALGTVVMLLIGGFLANVWLVKKPIIYHYSYSFTQPVNIDDDSTYEFSQPFVAQQDELRSIRMPLSFTLSIDPADTGNPNYDKVYVNSHEYRNRYAIEVMDSSDGSSLYSGLLTPDLLVRDSDGMPTTKAEIPLRYDHAAGRTFVVSIHKLDRHPATVQFQGAALEQTTESLPMGSTPDSMELSVKSSQPFTYLNIAIGYRGYPYRTVITVIVLGLLALLLCNLLAGRRLGRMVTTAMCAVNYLVLSAYAFFQFGVYTRYLQGFPDEEAHLSYIAYLKQHGGLIPDFADMQVYARTSANSLDLTQPTEFNRLGHPPLFYQIERVFGGMTISGGTATFDVVRMEFVSFLIGFIGIALVFYLGFTRIRKIPALHLLFGLMVISPPNLLFTMSGVSNDSMTLFAVSVFVFGMVRFFERRYDLLTYGVIACGVTLSFLSKLTAAMVVGLISLGVVIYTLFVERDRKPFMRASFLGTLPIYLVPIGYFGYMMARFHTLQPSFQKFDFSGYVKSNFYVDAEHRLSYNVWEYVNYYVRHFLDTWQALAGTIGVPKPEAPLYALDRMAVMAVLVVPLAVFLMSRSRHRDYFIIVETAMLATAVYQWYSAFNGFYRNGYPGAFSSRYYLCATSLFALAIVWMICRRFSAKTDDSLLTTPSHTNRPATVPLSELGMALCLIAIVLLTFDGFIYSLLYQADGVTGFTGQP
ncbi:hypothetical protein JS528_09230 [Bifidobacterium sp. MA2]|uniref:Glycosyltransferase RgtA/B/C/D-like domain-containing protein n=1 Tax=Bifidobacterium santillanense TaxID=2809028 RepID=A0ABS5URH4_9BIFI|nr:hypothetical protein [Bifidobacterium santillanense]MBT1173517.1 hypothetical protein [Bifidobacterium santillanense]